MAAILKKDVCPITWERFEIPFPIFQGWFIPIQGRLRLHFSLIGNSIWPPGSHFEKWRLPNNLRTLWDIFTKFSGMIQLYPRWVGIEFHSDWKSNMATRQPFWKMVSAQLLEYALRYFPQNFRDDSSLHKVGWDWISVWSEIQYGRQVAILKNDICPITRECFEIFSPNFQECSIFIQGRLGLHFSPIRNPIIMTARQPFWKTISVQ